jgi:hypothetical protein
MTSQISNNLSTHVVLTYSNNCYFITQNQEIALRSMNDNDRFYVNNFMVRVNTIKEILLIEDYYNNHPDKRPQNDIYENKTLEKKRKPSKSYVKIFRKVFRLAQKLRKLRNKDRTYKTEHKLKAKTIIKGIKKLRNKGFKIPSQNFQELPKRALYVRYADS